MTLRYFESADEAERDGWGDREWFGEDQEPAEIAPGAELVPPELVEFYRALREAA